MSLRYLLIGLILAGLFLYGPKVTGLSHLAEQKRGISNSELEKLDSVMNSAINEEIIPGAVLSVVHKGQTIYEKAFGLAQQFKFGKLPVDTPVPMTIGCRFDLASLTKVFATTFGAMLLVDQQKLDLDAPLYHYLPEFRGAAKDSVTIRHLLTHTAGLYPWKPIYYHASTRSDAENYITRLPLAYPVGKERHYSDLGFMLLGYVIESVSELSLDEYMTTSLYEPLGLKETGFNPPANGPPFTATSFGNPFEKRMVTDDNFGYRCDEDADAFTKWRQYVLVGEVNDGNAFHAHRGTAGHAGLFSTASELQTLLQLLLNKGIHDKNEWLSEKAIRTFLKKDSFGHGLGWAMSSDVLPAENLPEGSFGHTGFTGTYALAIPSLDLSIVLLTNRQHLGVNKAGYYNSATQLRKSISEYLIDLTNR